MPESFVLDRVIIPSVVMLFFWGSNCSNCSPTEADTNGKAIGDYLQPHSAFNDTSQMEPLNTDFAAQPMASNEGNPDVDITFSTLIGGVSTMAIQDDGRVVIGGFFSQINGVSRKSIARLNPDGTVDPSFGLTVPANAPPGAPASYALALAGGRINAVAIQSDGKILAGGEFSRFNNTNIAALVRLNPDGSLDSGFLQGGVSNGGILQRIRLLSDDKIVIAGNFTSFRGITRAGLARIHADGSLDTTFDPPVSLIKDIDLAVQTNDCLIVAGTMRQFGSNAQSTIVRIKPNGTTDSSFKPPEPFPLSKVICATLDQSQRILVGGTLASDSYQQFSILRLLQNGQLDPAFGGVLTTSNVVCCIDVDDEDDIVYGGYDISNTSRSIWNVALLNNNGTSNADLGTFHLANRLLAAIQVMPDSSVWVAVDSLSPSPNYQGGIICIRKSSIPATPPRILNIESQLIAIAGDNVRLHVEVRGALPVFYQWFLNGVSLPAATNANLTLSHIKLEQAGAYTVVVSNQWGAASNCIAVLEVRSAPNTTWTIDPAITPKLWTESTIDTMIGQPDGNFLAAGSFTHVNGQRRVRLVRLHQDGTLDTSFDLQEAPDSAIHSIALQDDGKIVVGGSFLRVGTHPRRSVARLHPDGTLDQTFDPGYSTTEGVNAVAMSSDGKIVVGGSFTHFAGTVRNGLVRLHSDGTLDDAFVPALQPGTIIQSIVIQPDGRIQAGGYIVRMNAPASWAAIQFASDGSATGFCTVAGYPGEERVILRQAGGGAVFLGASVVDRLTADFKPDTTFHYASLDGAFNDLRLDHQGNLLVSGRFTKVDGISRQSLARLNPDGTVDTTFDPLLSWQKPQTKNAGVLQPLLDGRVLVAGRFLAVPEDSPMPFAILDNHGQPANSLPINFDKTGLVRALVSDSRGGILVGGSFTRFENTQRTHLVRIRSDSHLDTNFLAHGGLEGEVRALVEFPDRRLLAGGRLWVTNYPTLPGLTLIKVDDQSNTKFEELRSWTTAGNSQVNALAQHLDGRILIGGSFTKPKANLCSAQPSTPGLVMDPSFNAALANEGVVHAIARCAPDQWFVGGSFRLTASSSPMALARFQSNGILDTNFTAMLGDGACVHAIALQPDGKILVGGTFATGAPSCMTNIVRLLSNGQADETFQCPNGANDTVFAIQIEPRGSILLGGKFTRVGGQPAFSLARLNSDGTPDLAFNAGHNADGPVYALCLKDEGELWVGGDFTLINGHPRNGVARMLALNLMAPQQTSLGFSTIVPTKKGRHYTLEYRDNVDAGSWQTIAPSIVGDGLDMLLSDPSASTPMRFYRVREDRD